MAAASEKPATSHCSGAQKIIDAGEEIYLVDIRSDADYQADHLPNAIHLERGLLEWRAPEQLTNTKRAINLYCRTSARGAFATERLSEIGYPNIFNVSDAFKGWVESGFPIYNRHGEFILTKGGFEKKENSLLFSSATGGGGIFSKVTPIPASRDNKA